MAPPEKKAKTSNSNEEDVDMKPKEEAPKKLEPPQEHEENAKPDKRPTIKGPVAILTPDTTLNVAVSTVGNMLLPLSEGGLRYLMAGARANVGIKSGRYAFEAKIVEQISFHDEKQSQFRVGFSTAGSSLLLGGEDSVCFDINGSFICNGKKTPCSKRFSTDAMVCVVLNLEEGHANCNTVSLFIAGARASQPQALPDSFKGKSLFPTVSFRNASVHFNFGPEPALPLPFSCKMVSEAATADVVITKYEVPKDGKYEVLFPLGLPDAGCFDWLDMFLAKNPQYSELSDRAIIAWAEKSGLSRKAVASGVGSNDKPVAGFGIPALDDHSAKAVLHQLASIQERNLVVMEVKSGLVKQERSALVATFSSNPALKTVAKVIIGEPPADFKARTLDMTLKVKQEASDKEFQDKKAEEKRLKAIEKTKKELAKKKAKMEKEAKKKLEAKKKEIEEAKKKLAAAKKLKEEELKKKKEELDKAKQIAAAKAKAKAEGVEYKPPEEDEKTDDKDKTDEPEEKESEEKKDVSEEKKEEPEVEEEEEEEEPEEEEEEAMEEDPPKVTLTPEEKKSWFFKSPTSDLTSWDFSTSFSKFSLPQKEDGFDEITYEWTKTENKCATYLKDWISKKKKTTRVEDLQPSQWFQQNWKQWQQIVQVWKDKANEYKSLLAKKTAEKAKKAAEKAAAEKKAKADAAKQKEATKKTEDDKQGTEAEKKAVDIFGVEDVCDIGQKVPLFKDFGFEDWALMSLSYELSLLVHAFRKDVNDPERSTLGMPLDHAAFYYNKYYNKSILPRAYGVETVKEVIALVKEAVFITKTGLLESHLPEDMESLGALVMLTEEARRHRSLLLDMGKEEARLKIMHIATSRPKRKFQEAPWRQAGGKGGKVGKSSGKGKGFRFALKSASRLRTMQSKGLTGKSGGKGGAHANEKGSGKGSFKGSKDRKKGRGKGFGKRFGKAAGKGGSKDGKAAGKDGKAAGKDGKAAGKTGSKDGKAAGKNGSKDGGKPAGKTGGKGKAKGARLWGSGAKGGPKGNASGKSGPAWGAKGGAGAASAAKGGAKGFKFGRPGRMSGVLKSSVAPRVVMPPGK